MAIRISLRTVLVGAIVAWPILSRAVGMDPAPDIDADTIVASIPARVAAPADAPKMAIPLPPKPVSAVPVDPQATIDRIGEKIVAALRALAH